jgi:DNA-binding FadR family transcriptional regulator
MSHGQDNMDWEIETLRQSIDRDWAALAAEKVSRDQRAHLREHLAICNEALRDALNRARAEKIDRSLRAVKSLARQ